MPNEFPLDVDMLLRVLNYLNLGVYITDRDRRMILWNRKAEEITGHRASDVVGKACHDQVLVHVDKNGQPLCSTDYCPLYRAMERNQESKEPILIYARRADGSRVAVSVSVAPLRDASGEVIGGIEAFTDETRRVRDLEFARKIQQHLLPASLPRSENVEFAVRYYPHDLIGGDFYDVRPLGQARYSVTVADVRGHGVSAALYTMLLKSLGETLDAQAKDPGEFLTRLNRELDPFVVEESFASAFYAIIDAESGALCYSNAGHPPPLHFRSGAEDVAELETHGLPLGIIPDEEYSSGTVALQRGDVLLCYTDGITEAKDAEENLLGISGLGKLLRENMARGASNLLERLYRQALDYCGEVALADDVLLLSVKRPT